MNETNLHHEVNEGILPMLKEILKSCNVVTQDCENIKKGLDDCQLKKEEYVGTRDNPKA